MRPKKLTIEGLHSFKERQHIDFEQLLEAGLFGIFGPTGSGKSTILDAITLALYGSVGRANKGTQGICNAQSEQVEVGFLFEVGIGAERKIYKVERSFKPQKDNPTYVNTKKSRLIEIIGEEEWILADKPSEINKKIEEEILGIKMDDFTRSVVLPQGKFSEFLSLTGSQRRDMLERIFNLGKYGKQLAVKLKSKLDLLKEEIARLEGAMASLGEASLEQLQHLEEELNQVKQNEVRLIKELKQLEQKHETYKGIWELQKNYEQILKTEQTLHGRSEEMQRQKQELYLSLQGEAFRYYIEQEQSLRRDLQSTKELLKKVEQEFEIKKQELAGNKEKYEQGVSHREEQTPILIQQRTKLEGVWEIEKELEEIQRKHKELQEEYKKKQQESKVHAQQVEKMLQEKQNAEDEKKKLEEEIENLQIPAERKQHIQQGILLEKEYLHLSKQVEEIVGKVKLQEQQCKKLQQDLEEIKRKKNRLVDEAQNPIVQEEIPHLREKLQGQQSLVLWIEEKEKEIDIQQKSLYKLNNTLTTLKQGIQQKENNIAVIESKIQITQKNYQELEMQKVVEQQKNMAAILAGSLEQNEPCPVCGSVHHPHKADPTYQAKQGQEQEEQKKVQEEIEELKKELTLCREGYINETAKEKMLIEQRQQLDKEIQEKQAVVEQKKKDLDQELCSLSIEEALGKLQQGMRRITEWEGIWKAVSELQSKEDQIITSQKVYQEHLMQLTEQHDNVQKQHEISRQQYDELLSLLQVENIESEQKKINSCEKQTEEIQKHIQQHTSTINHLQKEIEKCADEKEKIQAALTEMITRGTALKENKEEKEEKIRKVAGEHTVEELYDKVNQELKRLVEVEEGCKLVLEKTQTEFTQLSEKKAQLLHQLDLLQKNMQENQNHLKLLLQEKNFNSIEEAIQALRSEMQKKSLEQSIQQYEKQWSMVMEAKRQVESQLHGREISAEDWEEVQVLLQKKLEEREQVIEIRSVLDTKYKEMQQKKEQWEELSRSYKKLTHKQDLYTQLQALFKGNAFVEFIAEEHISYIAREASERLGKLTKHRYALEIDQEGGFIMRDDANGGIRRPVSSLSGGETFLTSLSLALALSSQIQLNGKHPLEFFFLDEGFGTLDVGLLDTVIGALERLHFEKMTIGVISHVNEIRERMGRRLIVMAAEAGEGSKIQIEKA